MSPALLWDGAKKETATLPSLGKGILYPLARRTGLLHLLDEIFKVHYKNVTLHKNISY